MLNKALICKIDIFFLFYICGLLFVVPRKLFAYFLGYFCNPTSKVTPSFAALITDDTLLFQFSISNL